MNAPYLLFGMVLLYNLFGPIVDFLVQNNPSSRTYRIKTKIFFRTFIAPAMFPTVFFATTGTNMVFKIFTGSILFIFFLLTIDFRDERYLANLEIEGDKLSIEYFTAFLKKKTVRYCLSNITDYEFTTANRWMGYLPEVNIQNKNQWLTFQLIDKGLRMDTQTILNWHREMIGKV